MKEGIVTQIKRHVCCTCRKSFLDLESVAKKCPLCGETDKWFLIIPHQENNAMMIKINDNKNLIDNKNVVFS